MTGWTQAARLAASERASRPRGPSGARIEPEGSSAWLARAQALAELVDGAMTPAQVVALRTRLSWSEDLVRNVMAYAERRTLSFRGGRWRRL